MPQCTFLNDFIFSTYFLSFSGSFSLLRFRLPSSCLGFIVAGWCIEQSVRWLLFGSSFIHFYSFSMDRNLVSVISQVSHTTFGYDSIVSVQICVYMLCEQTNSASLHRYSIFMHFYFYCSFTTYRPPHPRSFFLFVLFASIHSVSFSFFLSRCSVEAFTFACWFSFSVTPMKMCKMTNTECYTMRYALVERQIPLIYCFDVYVVSKQNIVGRPEGKWQYNSEKSAWCDIWERALFVAFVLSRLFLYWHCHSI